MATATQQRQTANGTTRPEKSLIEQAIEQTVNEKVKQIDSYLTDETRIAEIEKVLPDFMKGQATRLCKRARLTFADKESLQKCTAASFVKCVSQAAELGFAIDGRLCHAVPYNTKTKVDGRDVWLDVAQLQVDYKGMIAFAKRLKLVQDVWARIVYENDTFDLFEQDGKVRYSLSFDPKKDRGKPIGAYAVATHADGWFRLEWMSLGEINAIRARSKSYQSAIAKGFQTPWLTDEGEMQKKTVTKRLLKTFTDDPGLIRLLELDDQDIDLDTVIAATERRQVTSSELRTKLAPRKIIEPEAADELPETSYEPTKETQQSGEMSIVDQFTAEASECDTARSVATLTDNWIGPGSARELTPEDQEAIQNVAEKRIGELKNAK